MAFADVEVRVGKQEEAHAEAIRGILQRAGID
jgi:hypothetical protein